MKKIIFILCIIVALDICGQDISYPQLWFYSLKSPISANSKNDVEEYDNLKDELQKALNEKKYSDKLLVELAYRLYEIEKTSQIPYLTIDGKKLPFQCKDMSTDGVAVDFGASLIANDSVVNEDGFSFNRLRFGSPVTTIDPALFSYQVIAVILPSTKNLTYRSSPDIHSGYLEYLEGPDVIDHSTLISNDRTLIVAATQGNEHFKIPDGVLKIGAGAFRGSWLSSIEIPSSVQYIGENAFDLTFIKQYFIFAETVPRIENYAFGIFLDEDTKFYVPKKALGKYIKAYPDLKNYFAPIEKNKGVYYLCLGKSAYKDQDYAKALELFDLAAKNKCHEAYYWLGNYYTSYDSDPKKAYLNYEKAAKKKHAKSMYMCHFYPRYYSEPKDLNAAIKWLKLAIKNNYDYAAETLGDIYSDRFHEGFPLNLQEALNAYKQVKDGVDVQFNIERVEKLISLGADKRIRFSPNAVNPDNDEISQFLFSSLHEKNDFCLYDLALALINEYSYDEDLTLDYCKDLIDQWIDSGFVSYK